MEECKRQGGYSGTNKDRMIVRKKKGRMSEEKVE